MFNLSSTSEDAQRGRLCQVCKVVLVGSAFVFADVSHTLHLDHEKDDAKAPGIHAEVGHQKGNTTPSDEGLRGGRIVVSTSTSGDINGNTLRIGDAIAFIRS